MKKPIAEHPEFSASARALGRRAEVARVIDALIARIVMRPYDQPVVTPRGVRIVKSARVGAVPPLRLFYVIVEGEVQLLDVRIGDELLDAESRSH